MEGAAIMGLSLAKHGEITFKDGRVEQGNFDDYPVARIDEAPIVTNVYITPARHRGAAQRRRRTGRAAVRAGACATPSSPRPASGSARLPIGKQLET